ncbi:MAG: DinB family protein [Acidobacteriota bacterium]
MGEPNTLASLFLSKLEEQIERTLHLITLIPSDKLEWKPQSDALRVSDLLGHLLECLAGFCAALYAVKSDRLAHFAEVRELPVNHCCGVEEALERVRDYAMHIKEGFALLGDDDLARRVPTIFVPECEAVITILLGNLEHFINHKYQLFFYLKVLEIGVTTSDLYRIRQAAD